eukprot:gene13074-biopygen3518
MSRARRSPSAAPPPHTAPLCPAPAPAAQGCQVLQGRWRTAGGLGGLGELGLADLADSASESGGLGGLDRWAWRTWRTAMADLADCGGPGPTLADSGGLTAGLAGCSNLGLARTSGRVRTVQSVQLFLATPREGHNSSVSVVSCHCPRAGQRVSEGHNSCQFTLPLPARVGTVQSERQHTALSLQPTLADSGAQAGADFALRASERARRRFHNHTVVCDSVSPQPAARPK